MRFAPLLGLALAAGLAAQSDERVSQEEFKKLLARVSSGAESTSLRVAHLRAQGIAAARALAGGWVDWFNGGNPIEPPR